MLIIKYFLLISFSVKYFTWNKHNFFSKNKHEKIYIKKNTQILQVFDFIKQWLCDQLHEYLELDWWQGKNKIGKTNANLV